MGALSWNSYFQDSQNLYSVWISECLCEWISVCSSVCVLVSVSVCVCVVVVVVVVCLWQIVFPACYAPATMSTSPYSVFLCCSNDVAVVRGTNSTVPQVDHVSGFAIQCSWNWQIIVVNCCVCVVSFNQRALSTTSGHGALYSVPCSGVIWLLFLLTGSIHICLIARVTDGRHCFHCARLFICMTVIFYL